MMTVAKLDSIPLSDKCCRKSVSIWKYVGIIFELNFLANIVAKLGNINETCMKRMNPDMFARNVAQFGGKDFQQQIFLENKVLFIKKAYKNTSFKLFLVLRNSLKVVEFYLLDATMF